MSLYDTFSHNVTVENDGITIEGPKNADGSVPKFVIARKHKRNVKYTKAMSALGRKLQGQLAANAVSEEDAEKLTLDIFVDHILLSWSNIQDADGNPMACTRENKIKLLTDLPDLYDWLDGCADNKAFFNDKVEATEDEAKN